MDRERLLKRLTLDEGLELKPYKDSVGKLTIGIGRNLDDVGITPAEAKYLLSNDVDRAIMQLNQWLPWWRKLDGPRQEIMVNMMFNMGPATLMKFKNTLAAIKDGRYDDAAKGMRASLWARQTGARAERLAVAMQTGIPPA